VTHITLRFLIRFNELKRNKGQPYDGRGTVIKKLQSLTQKNFENLANNPFKTKAKDKCFLKCISEAVKSKLKALRQIKVDCGTL